MIKIEIKTQPRCNKAVKAQAPCQDVSKSTEKGRNKTAILIM